MHIIKTQKSPLADETPLTLILYLDIWKKMLVLVNKMVTGV